ncbi:aryl-sulfate sulfotransferase [Granulicella sibirica]|uniref:Putative PQQ enzyme repeat n=1 Tax=Granulicella sibirica TaxID=2479048 RepID=A0A4Q0T4H1_9BACT|nr:aryl-sulfate sulfotransferase [Granulicella sibirica]RXH56938.1 putative PQQ enzyme repeat [Granulicella sibirica]
MRSEGLPFANVQRMIATAVLAFVACTVFASPRVYPTGVTIYDPSRAYNCFVSFSSLDGSTHLIDMDGNEVHRWPHVGLPGEVIDPNLTGGKRGHVLLQLSDTSDPRGGIFTNRTVGELDWDGNTVWEWGTQAPGGAVRQNHDWQRLPNGNTLLLVTIPQAVKGLGPKEIGDQAIYEVTPDGKLVWQWVAGDHLKEFGFSADGMRYLRERIKRNPPEPYGYLEINDMQVLGPNHWFDEGDKRFDPKNIMIDTRKGNVVLIIERKTGKVVWRLGPYFKGSEYSPDQRIGNKTLPRPVDQISGQHNAHIIPKGLPGAGHLLLFDDEGGAGFPPAALGIYAGSRILEIDPVKEEIVWQYNGENSGRPTWTFFSSFVSSARRLPNGNTLIDEGMNGRIFQITPDGTIVWEYVTPYVGRSTIDGKPFANSLTYRAQPVPYDWAPEGTPHLEKPVKELDVTKFRVP